jgi:hypothetical protein
MGISVNKHQAGRLVVQLDRLVHVDQVIKLAG